MGKVRWVVCARVYIKAIFIRTCRLVRQLQSPFMGFDVVTFVQNDLKILIVNQNLTSIIMMNERTTLKKEFRTTFIYRHCVCKRLKSVFFFTLYNVYVSMCVQFVCFLSSIRVYQKNQIHNIITRRLSIGRSLHSLKLAHRDTNIGLYSDLSPIIPFYG